MTRHTRFDYSHLQQTKTTPFVFLNRIQYIYYILQLWNADFYTSQSFRYNSISYLSVSDQDKKFDSNHFLSSNFLFFTKSSMTAFFIMNMVDVPVALKQTKSVYFKSFELPILRFINYLMRGGLRTTVLKRLTNAIFILSHKWINLSYILPNSFNMLNMFDTLNVFFFKTQNSYSIKQASQKKPFIMNSLLPLHKQFKPNSNLSLTTILFQNFVSVKPLFSFYIENVGKSARKNRSKNADKFKLIWRYIPPYRRLFVTLIWFVRDLKFQKSKTFDGRLYKALESLFITPGRNLLTRFRDFVHFYVFKNFKQTLLKTLKSALK